MLVDTSGLPTISSLGCFSSPVANATGPNLVSALPETFALALSNGVPDTTSPPTTGSPFTIANADLGNLQNDGGATDTAAPNSGSPAIGFVEIGGASRLLAGAGPGGSPRVRMLHGETLEPERDFFAFDLGYRGGVFVGG